MEHDGSQDQLQYHDAADYDYEAALNVDFTDNLNIQPAIKFTNPKTLGTKKSEPERRDSLMLTPNLIWNEIQLKTRTDYYFFISMHAELRISILKNWPQRSTKMKILDVVCDERGTFFKLIHNSLTETHYKLDFFPVQNGFVSESPARTVLVKMKQSKKNPPQNSTERQTEPTNEIDTSIHPRHRKRQRIEFENPLNNNSLVGSDPDLVFQAHPGNITNEYTYTEDEVPDGYFQDQNNFIDFDALEGSFSSHEVTPGMDATTPLQGTTNTAFVHNHQNNTNDVNMNDIQSIMQAGTSPKRCGFPRKKGALIDQSFLLAEVARNLREKHVLVIHGLSGVGKSTLASEFGYINQHYYQSAVWIHCRTFETMMHSFDRIAKFLNINEPDGDKCTRMVLETLQSSQCLVIYDNCNEEMVETVFDGFLPEDPNPCHVIITTQLPEDKWPLEKMEVAQLTIQNYPDDYILRYMFGVLRIQDPTQETLSAAKDIIKEYKGFTLLMALIPQYIRQEHLTLPDFVRKYRDQFVNLAQLNMAREEVPLKMIIDSLDIKCKMFLRLLSFMNSLAGVQFFTESVFFVENQTSNTKFSELKRAVAKLTNLSLVDFFDDGQAVKIGHEWIEHYLTRSTTKEDAMLIFDHWDRLFNGIIHLERSKFEVCDIFAVLLKYLPSTELDLQIRYLNTVTDCLVNWTSPKPPQLYSKILNEFSNISLPQFLIWGVTHNVEEKLRYVVENFSVEYAEDHLHVLIASFYYARMLSLNGQFTESLPLLDRCQKYILRYLDPKHSFCQNIFREYAVALYNCGEYLKVDEILTRLDFQGRRIKDDIKCYLGLTKFRLNQVYNAWTILKEYIIDHIGLLNGCDLTSVSMKEALATLLQCDIMLNKPFPNILYCDTDISLATALQHAATLYNTRNTEFHTEAVLLNEQKFFVGQFKNEPIQEYTAIASQGKIIVIYRVAQVSKWCIVITNDFIWN